MANVVAMPDEELDGYIAKVGFHNNKVLSKTLSASSEAVPQVVPN